MNGKSEEIKFLEYLDPNEYIQGDEQKLNQVIRNLISNAIKFTPRGGKVTMRIRYKNSLISDLFGLLHS